MKIGQQLPKLQQMLFGHTILSQRFHVQDALSVFKRHCSNITYVMWQIQFNVRVQKLHSHNSERIIKIDPLSTKLYYKQKGYSFFDSQCTSHGSTAKRSKTAAPWPLSSLRHPAKLIGVIFFIDTVYIVQLLKLRVKLPGNGWRWMHT